MITEFMTKHVWMCSILLFGAAGLFLQWMMTLFLKGYVKASANMKTTRKKWMLNLKNQFETIYGMNYQVRNISAYVDKYLLKLRFLGLSCTAWERAPFVCVGVATLLAGGAAFYEYQTGTSGATMVEILFAYGMVCACQFVCFHIFSLKSRERQIHIQLVDYLENYLTNRLMREQDGERKLLNEDMEEAFLDGTADRETLKQTILSEEAHAKQTRTETEQDMDMLKRMLREMGERQREQSYETEPAASFPRKERETGEQEVAAACDNMEESDLALLEEFVQSFLA